MSMERAVPCADAECAVSEIRSAVDSARAELRMNHMIGLQGVATGSSQRVYERRVYSSPHTEAPGDGFLATPWRPGIHGPSPDARLWSSDTHPLSHGGSM